MAGVQAADSFEWFDCAALHGHTQAGGQNETAITSSLEFFMYW
jgi:hypothetical protein